MKSLIEFARIIEGIKLKSSDLLLDNKEKPTKTYQFYQKILAGEFRNDAEAALHFFKTDTNHSSYKNLKHSLRKKLVSTLFFIDPKKAPSDYERAYLFCCKHGFVAKILLFLTAKGAGMDLFQKVFAKAKEYELTEFLLMACKHLRMEYGIRNGDKEKFDYYNKVFKESIKIWEAEQLVEEYYVILMLMNNKKAIAEETHSYAKTFYNNLRPYLDSFSSPYLQFLGRYIKVIEVLSINDYETTIRVCEEAIDFFKSKPYSYNSPLRVFLHNQLICYTQLKIYDKGKAAALQSNALVSVGTYSWYVNNELHLVLALHSKEYQEAMSLLEQAIGRQRFKSLIYTAKERWLIYEAYINFLIFIDKIEAPEGKTKKFRLGKFLNSIPTFSKDKRGLNIPILVIQILFMIVKKDYDQAVDRIEAVEKYCSRYLRKNENFRSNCFIKLLLLIPVCDFHKIAIERKAKKYLDQLKTVPLEIANQAHEIEIIPYETLWEYVICLLSANFYKRKRIK